MKIHLANKILAGFSATLSLALLLTCIWMLTSLFVKESGNKNKCSWNYQHHRVICDDMPSPPSHSPSFEDEHGAIVIPNDEAKKPEWRKLKIWTEYYEMTQKFRTILILCLCGVIFGSLVQFVCAIVLICTPNYKIPSRSRRIVYILFSLFIIFMVGLALPLTFKREYSPEEDEDELHTMSTLSSSMMHFMNNFHWEHLLKDLYLYYLGLFANIIFIFLNMVVSCCLLRCTEYEDYDI